MSMTVDELTSVERAASADLELWPAEYQAWAEGVRVPLPPRQFERLLVVDVHVYKLRTRLRRVSPTWRYIHTHHSIGYRFDPERISS
jgi:DNA-binding response OmpR family regulator